MYCRSGASITRVHENSNSAESQLSRGFRLNDTLYSTTSAAFAYSSTGMPNSAIRPASQFRVAST
jgi:hypothetical protein